MTEVVLVDDRGPIRIITINRPEVRNAINRATSEALGAAMRELDARDDLTVAVITGAGAGFSAGMDLKAFGQGENPHIEQGGFGGFIEAQPAKPLIAAVEGFALAGGFELVLACDLVVAADDARFGLPEVSRGLLAAGGGLLRLPARLPRNVAMEMVLTGKPITAARAHHFGLVNRLAAPGAALAEALELAGDIVVNGPMAVAISKQIVVESADWPASEMWTLQRPHVDAVEGSDDAREGALAFVEKRAAHWTGR